MAALHYICVDRFIDYLRDCAPQEPLSVDEVIGLLKTFPFLSIDWDDFDAYRRPFQFIHPIGGNIGDNAATTTTKDTTP